MTDFENKGQRTKIYYKYISCKGSNEQILDSVHRMLVNYDETVDKLKKDGKSLEGLHLRVRRNETGEHTISIGLGENTIKLAPGWAAVEWAAVDKLSEAEKQFIRGEIRDKATEFSKAMHSVWNGGRCKDCKDQFEEKGPNRQSDLAPSLCVTCDSYRNGGI